MNQYLKHKENIYGNHQKMLYKYHFQYELFISTVPLSYLSYLCASIYRAENENVILGLTILLIYLIKVKLYS
jgi:hypothetical protein